MKPKGRNVVLSVSLPPALRDQARRAAFRRNQSVSHLVRGLLVKHLQASVPPFEVSPTSYDSLKLPPP